jgi:hypothetical protein
MIPDADWFDPLLVDDLPDVLRSALRAEYADASDAEMADALDNVLGSMSPAEAFNFKSALNQIGQSASKLAADPNFQQIVRTAAPIAGGALGTVIGGPLGTAIGTQLGNMAASALPARPVATAPRAVPTAPPLIPAPLPAVPVVPALPPSPPLAKSAPEPGAGSFAPSIPAPAVATSPAAAQVGVVASPALSVAAGPVVSGVSPPVSAPRGPESSIAGGSAAAARGLVLSQHPDVLQGLLATALGKHGRQQISGIPVAQLLALLSQVFEQAAADADALMYLERQVDVTESVSENASSDAVSSLYGDLIGADNLELADALEWEAQEW